MVRRIVISNVFGSFNRGDALLVETLYDAIRTAYGEQVELEGVAHFPELERAHLPNVEWHRPPGRSYSSRPWTRRFENALRTVGVIIFAACGAPRSWPAITDAEQLEGVRAIRRADLVVSCAGGFLIDTNLSVLGNLLQIAIAHRFGRPVIIAPQTIGPIRRRWIRPLLRWALNRCVVVCAREAYSYEFLQSLGVHEQRLRRLTDLALEHGRCDPDAGSKALAELGIGQDEAFLGASVVNWSFPRSATPSRSRSQYIESFCRVVTKVHADTGMRTLVVNQVSSDLPLAKEIKARLGEIVVIDEADRSPEEMRGLIRRSRAFFGSRFHSCVFALLENTPTYSLAYSYKSTGIMEDLGLGDYVTDIDGFAPDAIAGEIVRMIASPSGYREQIRRGLASSKFPRFSDIMRDAPLR